MGETTGISWTHRTFNGWIGCTKVSGACDSCYAEDQNDFRKWNPAGWGPHAPRKRTSAGYWRQPYKWDREAKAAGERRRVFAFSLADVFDNHKSIDAGWRSDLYTMIEGTPNLDWLLLTKRPQNVGKLAPAEWMANGFPSNVWLGTTVENREEMMRRGPILKAIPAAIHFWSCEPLLGGLGEIPADIMPDWIITGGESGKGARPMHPDWARCLRAQCAAAGVPFHFKQWGEYRPGQYSENRHTVFWSVSTGVTLGAPPHANVHDWGDGAISVRVGTRRSGRMLDGVLHDAFPEARKLYEA